MINLLRMHPDERFALFKKMLKAKKQYGLTWAKTGERFGLSAKQAETLRDTHLRKVIESSQNE